MLFEKENETDTPGHKACLTSVYSDDELAQIYSAARVDYIVPMPMNGKRMRQYINAYDIDLGASVVAVDTEDDQPNGVCMLGVRDDRTWITRLGVIPERRRRRAGQFLMHQMLNISQELNASLIQLEVIKGNKPAHRLFTKLGFETTRELHIIRRAPSAVDENLLADATVQDINPDHIFSVLEQREKGAAWTEETASLRNKGSIDGLSATLPSGETGWIVFHRSVLQLAHFVLQPDISQEMMQVLIAAVHQKYPRQDTKIENIPDQHPTWAAFQALNYHIAFSRIEMVLGLR